MLQRPFTSRPVRALGKEWRGPVLLRGSGILWLAKRWLKREGTVVLTFHRVLNDTELEGTASLLGDDCSQPGPLTIFLAYAH